MLWRDGSLFERDGLTPLLTKRPGGWSVGNSATVTWRLQGNTFLKAPSSAAFCRIVQGQVLKGSSYDVLYRLSGDGITRGNSREVLLRGAGLSAEELTLAALVSDRL
jgi:hypothetical protein